VSEWYNYQIGRHWSEIYRKVGDDNNELYVRYERYDPRLNQWLEEDYACDPWFGHGNITRYYPDEAAAWARIEELTLKCEVDYAKRAQEAGDGTEPLEEAIKNIGDLIRYTQVSDTKDIAANVGKTIDELSKKGFVITEVENKYLNPKSDYKGIHVDVISPEGQRFELQFHTAETLAAKEKMHKAYELKRNVNTPPETREQAEAEIKRIAAGMEWPPDVEKISNYQRE
jgi:hypothetical protein